MKKYLFAAFLVVGLALIMAPPQAFAQEEKPFTLHGEIRWRGEYDNNVDDFDSSADDGGLFWPYRVRIAAEGHFSRNITGWIEFTNTGTGGGDGSDRKVGDFGSDTHLYQGNVTINQLWSKNFSVTFGRQEIVEGSEFMLGDEDFYGGTVHDGMTARWGAKYWNVTAWWTRPVEGSYADFQADLTPDQTAANADSFNQDFWGGYFTWDITKNHKQNVDIYAMTFSDRAIGAYIQTIGGRYYHDGWDKSQFFWNIELAKQFGKASSGKVLAGSVEPYGPDTDASGMGGEGWIGYSFKGSKRTHRVWARFEYATGDDQSANSDPTKYEGFVNPFGELHNRAGHGDWFHVQDDVTDLAGNAINNGGLKAWAIGYTGYSKEKHEYGIAYWDYSLEQDSGNPNGSSLGQAFDLWYSYNMTKNVTFTASYSNLSPGDALTQAIPPPLGQTTQTDDSVERLYGQVRLRF